MNRLKRGNGLKSIFSKPRNVPTKRLREELERDISLYPIIDCYVGRRTVEKGIEKALNILSLGNLKEKMNELNYDSLYHSYIVVTLQSPDGKYHNRLLERNHIVEVRNPKSSEFEGLKKLHLNNQLLNIKQCFLNMKMVDTLDGSDNLFTYNARINNCQSFVIEFVQANRLSPSPEAIEYLTPQSGEKLIDSIPKWLRPIPEAITNAAANLEHTLRGTGVVKGRKKKLIIGRGVDFV